MKNTNAPPVYLLCFGEIGRLTEIAMPARIRQQINLIQFPSLNNSSVRITEKPAWLPSVLPSVGKHSITETGGSTLMHRLLFSRKKPLVICVLNPENQAVVAQANENLSILKRAGLPILGLFLDYGYGPTAEVPPALASNCLGYTQIRLDGHEEDVRAHRRTAAKFIRQIELLYHLVSYSDHEPSFLRILPMLLKETPYFTLAAGFDEDSLITASRSLHKQLDDRLRKPVRGRSVVMVLSRNRHLGFQEISLVHSSCGHLLGQRMHIKAGGNGHPHLRKGQYMLIGMVNEQAIGS